MGTVANIYDNGPISPVVKIKENVSLWTSNLWEHNMVEYIEPIPRGSPMVVDFVAASGAVTIAANGSIAKRVALILQLAKGEFLHLRWYPIDDMEGILWEQASQGRYATRAVQARVNLYTEEWDPWLATTTFFITSVDRDANIEVSNPMGIAWPRARFVFFGFRYILSPLKGEPHVTTYIPAEGRVA